MVEGQDWTKLFLTCGDKRKVRELPHDLPSYFTLHPQNNDLDPCTCNSLIAISPLELFSYDIVVPEAVLFSLSELTPMEMQTLRRWICYYRQKLLLLSKLIYMCDLRKSFALLGWLDANVFSLFCMFTLDQKSPSK